MSTDQQTATVTAWLFIESQTQSVEEMSGLIGVPCDKSWRKGDRHSRTGKLFPINSWKIESTATIPDEADSLMEAINECINDLLRRIQPHREAFKRTGTGETAGMFLGVRAETSPPLVFEAELIKSLADLGVTFEIDFVS